MDTFSRFVLTAVACSIGTFLGLVAFILTMVLIELF